MYALLLKHIWIKKIYTNSGVDEVSHPERILILTSFSHVTIFSHA